MKTWITNFDFEESLKSDRFVAPQFNAINDTLEFVFFWLCEKNDQLFTRQSYDSFYINYIENLRRTKLHSTNDIKDTPLPWWGNTLNEGAWKSERLINSNLTAHKAREDLGLNILESKICRNFKEVEFADAELKGPILFKEEFGFSGRGLHRQWQEEGPYPVIVERLVQRVRDFGIRVNESELKIIQNLVDGKGSYKGSFMKNFYEEEEELKEPAQKIYSYYKEKFGVSEIQIDCFQYLEEGVLKLNPFCEVNHRRSMGNLADSLQVNFGNEASLLALVNKKSMKKRRTFSHSIEELGALNYNPITKKGIIKLSPEGSLFSAYFLTEDSERTLQHLIKEWWVCEAKPTEKLPSEFIIYF